MEFQPRFIFLKAYKCILPEKLPGIWKPLINEKIISLKIYLLSFKYLFKLHLLIIYNE